ncbi:MAG: hypothetical protein Q9Q13_12110 [Acidobacteriota bacterium]|nr:hypothetical protein [Acidobacteriota bacterium]
MSASTTTPSPPRGRKGLAGRFDLRRDGGRIMVVLAGLLVLNLAFWWIVVRPLQEQIEIRQEQKATARKTEQASAQRLEQIRRVHDHALAVQQHVRTSFDEMLSVRSRRFVRFQTALYEVGREFKVQPRRAAITRQELEQEGIEVFAFTFPLNGGYENLRSFLARLEQLDQFLIVREISLRSEAREGGRNLQLDIAVETYFNAPNMKEEIERERLWKLKQRRRSGRRRRP